MQLFKKIASGLKTRAIHTVPGENDAALDGGVLYREHFGERATTRSITRASISSRSTMCRRDVPSWRGTIGVAQGGPRSVSQDRADNRFHSSAAFEHARAV
jgi:hypothetical protein